MIMADLLLHKDELPPKPSGPEENNAGAWRRFIQTLKKKKQELSMSVVKVRKECQKARKGLQGNLPAEPRVAQLPMWEKYLEELKACRTKVMQMKAKGMDMARKLGDARHDLLTEPKGLHYRKWERYYRKAKKFLDNIVPVQKQADEMKAELDGELPEPPEVWEKQVWRDYVNTLRGWKRDLVDLKKRIKNKRDEMKGNELPETPDNMDKQAWLDHKEELNEIQKKIDEKKKAATKLKNEFKGTPDLPWDDDADDESNKMQDWIDYMEALVPQVEAIEQKRKEANIWIKRFVEKLGVPAEDMPDEPGRPYSIEDWEEHIFKLTNLEDELDNMKKQAKDLLKDECFSANAEKKIKLPTILSPKAWMGAVKELTGLKDSINGAMDKGKALTKELTEGNKIPEEPGDNNLEAWEGYIKKMELIKKKVTDMYPYADILRDATNAEGKTNAALADKIKRCRKPKNMSIDAWKKHILKMEKLNPLKKHKDVEKDAEFALGTYCKVTGFHFFKFPMHNGFGKVCKVILLDPFTIGYEVELDEGKYINAQTNLFEEKTIPVGPENLRIMPKECEGDLATMVKNVKKLRQNMMKCHQEVAASADAVKKIQDQIRLCSAWGKGVDVNALKNKEKKLRKKRTNTAAIGVKAGKKKMAAQKELEAMEEAFLKEMKDATSTFVWVNGIMLAKLAKDLVKWFEALGYHVKNEPGIGPDKLGYEMGYAVELGSRAERAKMVAQKEFGPKGKMVTRTKKGESLLVARGPGIYGGNEGDGGDDDPFHIWDGKIFNTDGGPLKIHAKVPS